jgi:secreted Zn-dependent insulinase-like peptidase
VLWPVGPEGVAMANLTPNEAFSVIALIAEAQRELDMRRQVYWSRVRAGKMRQDEADKRIALMATIVKRLTVTAAL